MDDAHMRLWLRNECESVPVHWIARGDSQSSNVCGRACADESWQVYRVVCHRTYYLRRGIHSTHNLLYEYR